MSRALILASLAGAVVMLAATGSAFADVIGRVTKIAPSGYDGEHQTYPPFVGLFFKGGDGPVDVVVTDASAARAGQVRAVATVHLNEGERTHLLYEGDWPASMIKPPNATSVDELALTSAVFDSEARTVALFDHATGYDTTTDLRLEGLGGLLDAVTYTTLPPSLAEPLDGEAVHELPGEGQWGLRRPTRDDEFGPIETGELSHREGRLVVEGSGPMFESLQTEGPASGGAAMPEPGSLGGWLVVTVLAAAGRGRSSAAGSRGRRFGRRGGSR